jgi:glycosyltransferase involved in cell wall biosynthesis
MRPTSFTWISPYHPDDARGGWKSMQFHLLRALEAQLGAARRVAPVEVPEEFVGKWASRIQKKLGIPRRYACYSESRLTAFAETVHGRLADNSGPVVFFGPLPFVKCRPAAPYYIYTDGAFFIHYRDYNQDHSHDPNDIKRIEAAEAEFMRRSAGVWCSSQWVADRITREYGLEAGKAMFVGTGPGDVPPPVPPVCWGNYLVMIAADFERKGGRLAAESVAEARKLGADINLKFIGAEPPPEVLALPFVEWCGWLDMKTADDRSKFAKILSQAGAQILLSRNDLTPLAIAEAATCSKATIATAVGGIPEMIQDGKTGWLIRPEASPAEIGARLAEIFKQPAKLAEAGNATAAFCAENWSWKATANRCIANMTAQK